MPRYYFDHRDGDTLISDDEGLEFDGIKAVRDEATRALAGIAKDELPGSVRREIAIEVRDEASRPVLRAALWFEVQTLA
jgi:hypothetical protein